MSGIIDAHSHFMPQEVAKNTTFFKVHWSNLERQLSTMDQLGIEKSLLLYPTSDAHIQMGSYQELCRIYNENIAEVVKKYPDRFIGAGILPVDDQDEMMRELKKFKGLGLKVISLASSYDGKYLDDEIFHPIYAYAQKNQMLIQVHSQTLNPIGEERVKDPLLSPVLEYVFDVSMSVGKLMMSGVLLDFSDVKFLIAHYGGVLPFVKERFDNTYQMLRKREYVKDLKKMPSQYFQNLYFDTSGSQSQAALLCTCELVDPSHILFGSDFPANQNIIDSISAIKDSCLDDVKKRGILSNILLRSL